MICIAKTGSGKTCGFLLPSFHQYIQSKGAPGKESKGTGPIILVLAPTREVRCVFVLFVFVLSNTVSVNVG
jgi:ATP-dependent RNA helicase DDX5/DBP2